jgi:hypothetical protein
VSSFVIGVDPGASCGMVVLVDGRRAGYWQGPRVDLRDRLVAAIDGLRHTYGDEITISIACERFTRRPERGNARTQQSDAEWAIGVVEDVAIGRSCVFRKQSPGSAKRMAPNSLLRLLGLLTTAREVNRPDANDVNDAMRHAVLTLATIHAVTFDRLIAAVNR